MSDSDNVETEVETTGLLPIQSEVYETILYVMFIIWGAYLLLEAWGWQRRDRLFPLVGVLLLICLIAVRLTQVWFPQRFPSPQGEDGFDIETQERGRSKSKQELYTIYLLIWVLALALLIFFIGFMNALIVFVPSFVYFFRRSVRASIVMLVFAYALTYALFILVLNIYPWDGYFDIPQILYRF